MSEDEEGHAGRVYRLKLVLSSYSGGSCSIFFSQNNFALTNPEKSTHEDSDTKETRREEELDAEVLEVLNPTQEWQALQPGTSLALLLRNSELKPQMPFVPEGWERPCSW